MTDSFSLGVLVYIMLCGYPPFCGPELRTEKAFKIPFWPPSLRAIKFEDNVPFPSPHWDCVSKEAKSFVASLLRVNPKQRMPFGQTVENVWFLGKAPNEPLKHAVLTLKEFLKLWRARTI